MPPGGQCLGAGDRERVGLPAPLTTAPQASPPRRRKGWTAPWGRGGVQEPEQEGRGSGSDSGTEPSDRNPNTISPPHAYSPFCLLVKKQKTKKSKKQKLRQIPHSGPRPSRAPGRAAPRLAPGVSQVQALAGGRQPLPEGLLSAVFFQKWCKTANPCLPDRKRRTRFRNRGSLPRPASLSTRPAASGAGENQGPRLLKGFFLLPCSLRGFDFRLCRLRRVVKACRVRWNDAASQERSTVIEPRSPSEAGTAADFTRKDRKGHLRA